MVLIEILIDWRPLLSSVSVLLETYQCQHKSKKPSSSKMFLSLISMLLPRITRLNYTACMSSSKKSLRSGMLITHCANYILPTQRTSSSCYTYALYPSKLSPHQCNFPQQPKGVGGLASHHHCSHLRLGPLSSSWSPPLPLAEEGVGWEEEGATE